MIGDLAKSEGPAVSSKFKVVKGTWLYIALNFVILNIDILLTVNVWEKQSMY